MAIGQASASRPSVLISGASSGIGLATAQLLAYRGWRVFAGLRRPAAAPPTLLASGAEIVALDVTDPAGIAAALTTVQQAAGRLDALVCNAGIQIRGYFEDLGDAELRQMFATNLFGAMATVRAALPHMRRAGRGRIVLVSSIGGRIGSPAMSGYCAGKFALEGFGEALALECAPLGIKVALVAPPIVATPIWTTNRAMAAATGPHSPYRRAFEAVERLTAGLVARAEVNSDQVAALIAHVLECAQPRLRYSAGRRASALLVLRRYLPELWFERAYRAVLLRVQTTGATGRQAWRNS